MNKNLKVGIVVGGIILAILIVLPLMWAGFSGWRGAGWGMMGPGWGMMGPGMMGGFGSGWFMIVFMILFWGLIIWGIVALVRGVNSGKTCGSSSADSAIEVLKRRYAQGEIGKKEFEEKKRDLV
jgi:putative membrane protein